MSSRHKLTQDMIDASASPLGHTHPESDIVNLTTDLAAKADLSSGKVPTSELGTGTADSSKFLRGDQTWQAVTGGGTPASTVQAETSYGQSSAVGTATNYAREDHTHGSPSHDAHANLTGIGSDDHHARSHDHSNASDGNALAPATLTIPGATTPAQTAEGSAVWDTDDDKLTIGTGAARKTLVNDDDSRLTDARTPTAHAASHQNGGSDEVASATAGANLIPKAGAGGTLAVGFLGTGTPDGTKFLRDDGTWQTPSGGGMAIYPAAFFMGG